MALVGSPIEFVVKYTILSNSQCIPSFKWSFGDGFDAVGVNVQHFYKYSGEYQVVLNGSCGENNSVSRTTVSVISPNISILNNKDGDIEVTNNSKIEANIGSWKIITNQKDFIFPKDTIISANNKITLAKEDVGINASTSRVSLDNPSNGEVVFIEINANHNIASVDSSITVAEAEILAYEYKQKLGLNKQKITEININDDFIQKEEIESNSSSSNDMVETATALNAENSAVTRGLWEKIIQIPINSIKSFAHMFYDF